MLRVVDGDTVELVADLGFKIGYRFTARLDGINAPELRTPEGNTARTALLSLIGGKTLEIRTLKDQTEKYGRMLVVIMLEDGVSTANQWLIDHGFAVPYSGGAR